MNDNPKTILANNLSFTYHEQGQGPLLLCLHGFPDTPHTWHHLMPKLAQAGYHVVAPFMRGYPPTAIPINNDYSPLQLGQDVLALIEAFGAETAVVIGHDWGAFAAYSAANQQPERITQLITAAIPHPRTIRFRLGAMWRARHFITFLRRQATLNHVQKNNFAFIDTIYRRWSPTWSFAAAELTAVKQSLAQPGGTAGALGYYWSFAEAFRNKDIQRIVNRKVSVPTLTIVGEKDGALDVSNMSNTPTAFTGHYQYKVMPNVGHFLHREAPDPFAEAILAFLQRS